MTLWMLATISSSHKSSNTADLLLRGVAGWLKPIPSLPRNW